MLRNSLFSCGPCEKDTIGDQCPAGSEKNKTGVSGDRSWGGSSCQTRSVIKHGVRADESDTRHRTTQEKRQRVRRDELKNQA